MERLDLDRLSDLAEPLAFFFYLLMFVALLAIFAGATGSGIVLLVAGAGLHVVRASIAELGARRRERTERKREVRLRSHRVAQRARVAAAQASGAAAAIPAPSAADEIRVTKTPRLTPRAPARG